MLLQIFYSVRSEHQLMAQTQYNLLFRWFIGLSMTRQGEQKTKGISECGKKIRKIKAARGVIALAHGVLQTHSSLQRSCLVCTLPSELWLFTTKVAVSGGLAVDGAQQVEHLDDAFGAQVKVFGHQGG